MKLSKAEQMVIAGMPLTKVPDKREYHKAHGNTGGRNGSARLDPEKVRHIRANGTGKDGMDKGLTDTELGVIHGVHAQTIKYVRTWQTWRDIE